MGGDRVRVLSALLAALTVLLPAHAWADWRRAETDRFIVYGQSREALVREYAEKLTTFDAVLRKFHPSTADRLPHTKLKVILVKDLGELRRIRPDAGPNIGGVYIPMNEGLFAIVRMDAGEYRDQFLFHEYTHHFMYEYFPAAYPAWLVEGWAEYFMTAEFERNGDVTVGGYNPMRAHTIFNQRWLPAEQLLRQRPGELGRAERRAFYSQAWLLTHYMVSDRERSRQLDKAIGAISTGTEPVKAFTEATGKTTEQLTEDLRRYRKLPRALVKNPLPNPPAIQVTTLPASADDLFLDEIRLLFSSTRRPEPELLEDIRRRAARHRGDPLAERVLARAEFMFGDVSAGEATVQKLLAARPDDVEALIAAGWGQLYAGLRDPAGRTKRFAAARPLFAKAYQIDQRDFRPLFGYAYARSVDPSFPTDNDIKALLEARMLAPAVQETSLRAGIALLQKGRRDEAAAVLARVVNDPHGGAMAAQARAALAGRRVSQADADAAAAEEAATPPEPPEEGEPAAPAAPAAKPAA